MTGIILGAGSGHRLGALTEGLPKCLLRIGDKRLIEYQAEVMVRIGVDRVVTVVGYKADEVIRLIFQRRPPIRWDFVENPHFSTTNTLYSLYLARDAAGDDILFCNGDVLFRTTLAIRLLDRGRSTMAVVKKQCGEEEVKVRMKYGKIIEIGKHIEPSVADGEFVGVALWKKGEGEKIFTALEQFVKKERKKDFFEAAINSLLPELQLYGVDVTDEPVVEIDFPEDLHLARTEILPLVLKEKDCERYSS
ncbi:MAG: phosphocholine cytidylyltransferase family protein [Planctomycetota bacterium]|nr:phosphocholine cytidylyltransferase family protein [Planctomycetota bacterium]